MLHVAADAVQLDEIHRFPNTPVVDGESLRWDARTLWREMRRALDTVGGARLSGIGVDTWGVDYALVSPRGDLLSSPHHYRDARNAPAMEQVLRVVSKDDLYARTGVQFMPINTVNQLFAAQQHTPALLDAADKFVMMPDLFNYWLTGKLVCEYTDASTSQLIDPVTRSWAFDLMERLSLPARLAPPLVEPGTILGPLRRELGGDDQLAGTPVIATASHDTASAVAAITARDGTAFVSSGTWSLVGMEIDRPILTPHAMQLNFSNEGGIAGTTRLLKNVTGLWLLQGCRRCWSQRGETFDYAELTDAAGRAPALAHLVDPDDPGFANPPDMLEAIDRFCRKTGQSPPGTPGAYARTVFDSLALKYRCVIGDLECLVERPIDRIRIIGGGSQNALLNQLTADATGRPVVAGPTEATALGNIAVQMLATGAVGSIAEARQLIDTSFPPKTFEPRGVDIWDRATARFQEYCGRLYA